MKKKVIIFSSIVVIVTISLLFYLKNKKSSIGNITDKDAFIKNLPSDRESLIKMWFQQTGRTFENAAYVAQFKDYTAEDIKQFLWEVQLYKMHNPMQL